MYMLYTLSSTLLQYFEYPKSGFWGLAKFSVPNPLDQHPKNSSNQATVTRGWELAIALGDHQLSRSVAMPKMPHEKYWGRILPKISAKSDWIQY